MADALVLRQTTRFRSIWKRISQIRPTFISIHYAYIITWAIIGSVVLYRPLELPYIDSLFLSAGASSQSGLNTIDFNLLYTYQQAFLYFISMVTNPVFINSFVVFVRLHWFEKRFQHIVRDARALRWSRSRTFENPDEHQRETAAVGNRPIVVLHNDSGEGRGRHENTAELEPGSSSDTEASNTKSNGYHGPNSHGVDPVGSSDVEASDLERSHLPAQEHHITLLENQRRSGGALRIPSPMEYDRGDMPLTVEENGVDAARVETHESDPNAHHITINEPTVLRSRARTSALPVMESRRTIRDDRDGTPSPELNRNLTRRGTLDDLVRSLTEERERDTLPYLSWSATIGRNSAFVNLTEDQREELGGIEYRALKTLALILITYFLFIHTLGVVCLVPWILNSQYGLVVTSVGQGRPWWGVFTAGSAFTDLGFTLTPDSMISFQDAVFPLLLTSFLIVAGNTGFPCLLRLTIWTLSKIVPSGNPLWEELRFLLDHPRRCFTLLFPRNATWWLFVILVLLNGVDLIFFIILDINDPVVTSLSPGIRVLDGFFQAVSTRTAGFAVVNLADLHPAIQVSYMIMMYISVFPIAISMRRTNVYEEKSLGIYPSMDEADQSSKEPNYIGAHLRKQLSFDLWYIFLGLFIIAIAEGDRIQNPADPAFNLFNVLFEVVSAYGTVGLSLGYPGVNASFSSQFRTLSKLVMISMQIRGRHRGLPYSLDRAILLPSESLQRAEIEQAERRRQRRSSTFSDMSRIPSHGQQHNTFSDTAMSTARERQPQLQDV
ncbi:Cation transport domain containing protein [Elaphomyces granulatus]